MGAKRGRSNGRSGLAGIEFALLCPVLLTLLLGTIDISNALLTARRLFLAAGAVAEIASTSSVQSQALNVLTDVQAWQATTAAFVLFPSWTNPVAKHSFAITISAIAFSVAQAGCTQNCSYTASVRWSLANDLGATRLRKCGPVAVAGDTDPRSYLALPAGDFGPTSLFVSDISATYRPIFFGFLIGSIPMMQSAYISPRINNDTVLMAAGGAGASVICPPSG
jgi:Flp pilus assembly protein TadG